MANAVLLAGEDPLALDVLAEAVKPLGLAVETAPTAWGTLEKLKKNQFSALLIDKDLPDASGIDVVRELRKWQKGCAALVFVQYPGVEGMVQALQAGAADVFEKPFPGLEIVTERLRAALVRQQTLVERDSLAVKAAELEMAAKRGVESPEAAAQRQRLLEERPQLIARIAELEAAARKPLIVESPESIRKLMEAEAARDAALRHIQALQAAQGPSAAQARELAELQQRFEGIKARYLKALQAMKTGAATIANILGSTNLPVATSNEFRELRRLLTTVIEDRS